jgi:2-phospho-L-lactate guanylyltransferase
MRDHVAAVVVARVGEGAKSRLSSVLGPADRRQLALAMLADTLRTCAQARRLLHSIVAVVDDPVAARLADTMGATTVADPRAGDMNAAAEAGIRAARAAGATTAIILPGDIPLLSKRDLERLLGTAAGAERVLVVAASHDGVGTNALLLRPPDLIDPSFGPPSVARHLRLGKAAAALTYLRCDLDLALDIDTPADLAVLADRPVGSATAAALSGFVSQGERLIRPGPSRASGSGH